MDIRILSTSGEPSPQNPAVPHALSLAPSELKELVLAWDQPGFRGDQVVQWVFERRVLDPDAMSNLPQTLRERLKAALAWTLPEIKSRLDSPDGASKLLLASERGLIEAVILR